MQFKPILLQAAFVGAAAGNIMSAPIIGHGSAIWFVFVPSSSVFRRVWRKSHRIVRAAGDKPMGISLFDRQTGDEPAFDINFWHWRAIVEAIRSTRVIPDAQVDGLHEPFCGNGLTTEQARAVAAALRATVILALSDDDWLGLDQSVSTSRRDGPVGGFTAAVERGEDLSYLYQTNRAALESFAKYCDTCNGFSVF